MVNQNKEAKREKGERGKGLACRRAERKIVKGNVRFKTLDKKGVAKKVNKEVTENRPQC